MNTVKTFAIAACVAAASAATAQNLHVNDAAYVGIARCQGLVNSHDLAPPMDPTGINRFMDLETAGRIATVIDQAREARQKAEREAATGNDDQKARLESERNGPCRRWMHIGARAPGDSLTGE